MQNYIDRGVNSEQSYAEELQEGAGHDDSGKDGATRAYSA